MLVTNYIVIFCSNLMVKFSSRYNSWYCWTAAWKFSAKVQVNCERKFDCKYNHHKCKYLPYLLTPWCRVLLEKLTGLQLVKKFPSIYGTRRFITALTSVRHLSLSWASPFQSTYPHPTSCRSIQILSTHLRLGHPSGLFPSSFPNKILTPPLLTHTWHTSSPSHSSRFYHRLNIVWRVQII